MKHKHPTHITQQRKAEHVMITRMYINDDFCTSALFMHCFKTSVDDDAKADSCPQFSSLLEAIFLPFIEKIRFRTAKVDDLWTAVPL